MSNEQKRMGACMLCGQPLEQIWLGYNLWVPKAHPECVEKREQAEAEEKATIQQAQIEARRAEMMSSDGQNSHGIAPQYHGALITDLPNEKLVDNVRTFLDGKVAMLTLTGDPGTGKTRALFAIYRQAVIEGKTCRYTKVPLLVKELQAACGAGGSAELTMLRELMQYSGLLLLDELGQEKATEFVINDLGIIIGEREQYDRSTAIATNCTFKEIADRIDKRIADRMAGGLVCKLLGHSKRLKRHEQTKE